MLGPRRCCRPPATPGTRSRARASPPAPSRHLRVDAGAGGELRRGRPRPPRTRPCRTGRAPPRARPCSTPTAGRACSTTTDMRRRSLSNGISSTTRSDPERAPHSPNERSATSIGSPSQPSSPPFRLRFRLWQCRQVAQQVLFDGQLGEIVRGRTMRSTKACCTDMLFCVSVPVLSLQMTVVAAERLDRRQVAHQCLSLRHALGSHRERQGDGRQQSLGHVRDDDADREHGAVPDRHADGDADGKEHGAEQQSQPGHEPRQACDLALQRRTCLAHGLRQVRDAPELGAHAGREDHGRAAARDERRPGQHDVLRLPAALRRQAVRGQRDRHRLTGERREVHPQSRRFDQPAVCRYVVPCLEQDQVARHERRWRAAAAARRCGSPSPWPGAGAGGRPSPVRRGYSCRKEKTPLIRMTATIAHPSAQHAFARVGVLGEERERRRHPEDQREEMGEFAQQPQPGRLATQFLDAVGTVFGPAPARLGFIEPCGGGLQARQDCPRLGVV